MSISPYEVENFDNIDTDALHSLFNTAFLYMLTAGGDGDSWIVCQRYTELADKFREFFRPLSEQFYESTNEDGRVSFIWEQEGIHFVRDRMLIPECGGDIIVEIY